MEININSESKIKIDAKKADTALRSNPNKQIIEGF